jgi:hypothetical protein
MTKGLVVTWAKFPQYEVAPVGDRWAVIENGTEISSHATNADAWRWVERQTGEPISISESIRSHY